jgi:hypothetical protein
MKPRRAQDTDQATSDTESPLGAEREGDSTDDRQDDEFEDDETIEEEEDEEPE